MKRKLKTGALILGASLWATISLGQEIPKEYQKKYDGEQIQSFLLLTSKKNYYDKIILNGAGEKVATLNEKRPLIFISSKGKAYVANSINGFNDGGGFVWNEFQDIDIIDLATNTTQKADFNIRVLPYDGDALIVFRKGDRFGAMNKSEEIVLEPKNKSIEFIKDNTISYLIVDDKEYFLIDTKGQNFLGQRFVHGDRHININVISSNTILASNDGKGFGLYSLLEKREIVPYSYDDARPISNHLYEVKKNGASGVYDGNAKALILPFELEVRHVSAIMKSPIDSTDYFFVNISRNDKSLVNIVHNNKLLVEEKYQLENLMYKDNFPFVGGYNADGKYYIFDMSQPKMLIDGLPHIEGMTRIEYLKGKPGFVRVESVIDPQVTNGDNRDWVMLLNTDGKVLSGYRAAQAVERFDLEGGKPIITTAYRNSEGSYTVQVMFGPEDFILKDLKLSDTNFTVVENKLSMSLPSDISNVLPSGESVMGGKVLIDATGKVEFVK